MSSTTSSAKEPVPAQDMKSILDLFEDEADADAEHADAPTVPKLGKALRYYGAGQLEPELIASPVGNTLTVTLRQQNSPDSAPVKDGNIGLVVTIPVSCAKSNNYAWPAIKMAGAAYKGPFKSVGVYVTAEQAATGAVKRSALDAKTAPPEREERTDQLVRMMAGADLRGLDDKDRKGQKDNAAEMRRLKSMCKKENVSAPSLMAVGRHGKLLALRFPSRSSAKIFEDDFKQIDYDGTNSRIWSEIVTNDNKSSAYARIQLLQYMIGCPVKKKGGNKKDYSCVCL